MVIIATWAGIHRGYQHETGRIVYGKAGSGYRDVAVFQRLPEDFQYIAVELGQFVEEENAVVGKADFSRLRVGASSDHRNVGDGMMGRTEWTASHE